MRKPGTHRCPECARVFPFAHTLGVHRRFAHGIIGTSQTAIDERAKNAAKKATTIPKLRGPYNKHPKPPTPSAVNYCPKCGTHIGAIVLALQLTNG